MSEEKGTFFETEIRWVSAREGRLEAKGLPPISVDAPPEFKGRGQGWSPEHLLVGSVNSCLMLTFVAIAENSKVPLASFSSAATGKLEKVERAGYQITEIVIKPRVVVTSPQDLARVPRMLEKAKENCFVSNSLKSAVKLEPEISHQ
ncbi:MAG TPA: OsmC family protein [Candidatus Binatia bacterium]|nr:OsmC family protein [Candidatus Binatia bacterium]